MFLPTLQSLHEPQFAVYWRKCQTFRIPVTRQHSTLSHTQTHTLVAHTHTHKRHTHIQMTHTLTSGIISTCTTCTSIDNSDHIATSNGLRFAPLLLPSHCHPLPCSFILLSLCFSNVFFAIVNGNFAAPETFCFLLLSITNSFVIFRLHNRQQQQQQAGEGEGRGNSGRQQNGAHVRTKFCLRLAAALCCFAGTEGASCRFVYRFNLRHNAKMFETYWKLTPCFPPLFLLFPSKRSFSLAFPIKAECVGVEHPEKKGCRIT